MAYDSKTESVLANQLSDASQVVEITGKLARNGSAVSKVLQPNNKGTDERLYTARARYAGTTLNDSTQVLNDRGQWAYIKLMTSQTQYREYVSGSTSRDISYKEELLGSGGILADMSDPNGTNTYGYDKFLLTSVSCGMSEKVQISEVFGDNEVVYYFGRQPLIFNFSGILIDSVDNNWFVDWLKLYSDVLRGTQTARNYELIKIVLPNMVITGTISDFNWQQEASRDVDVPFSFRFIAKTVEPTAATSASNINNYRAGKIDFSKANAFTSQAQVNSLKNQLGALSATIQSPTASLRDRATALSQLGSGIGGSFGSFLVDANGTLTGSRKTIEGWNISSKSYLNSIQNSGMFQTVTSSLNGIRANLFSPIYGVLSSLTKLVSNAFNTANSVVNNFVTPVRNILRDIANISKQAIALVNLVNNSIRGFGRNVMGQLNGLQRDFKTAVKLLGKASGAIGTAPITAAQSVANMFSNGYLDTSAPFLKSTPKLTFTRPTLTSNPATSSNKVAILKGVAVYTAASSNKI